MKRTFLNHRHQQKESNSQYDTCWIYNTKLKCSKKVKKSNLKVYLIDDWKIGRKIKFHNEDEALRDEAPV
jgi:hypothetical protein